MQSKIYTDGTTIKSKLSEWRADGQKIVFTNGCFDLLHVGHVLYLAEAKSLGTKLVVALNSDASVTRLKGSNRPIQDEYSRTHVMAALECVDMVIVFDEATPLALITNIQPDILVKGGDWRISAIVGSDIVLAKGGEVRSLKFIPGYSTTEIEEKIIATQPILKSQNH